MTGSSGVVIVGASLAGITTAEALRRDGYAEPITVIGDEAHVPYSRPPLSKQVLGGTWAIAPPLLRPEQFAALGIELRSGQRATGVDLASRTVTVGETALRYDHLVIATGVRSRKLAIPGRLRGIHVLRSVDDALALRQAMAGAHRVAVVGAGVLGCEIAAALSTAGLAVTLIGRTPRPRIAGTGGHVSRRIAEILASGGVTLRMGVGVVEAQGAGHVSAVLLTDGSVLAADLVVAAIGSTPDVEWLESTDLDLTDGVLCDADGEAGPRVHAAGDVARWLDPATGQAHRVEHQATAIEQALAVARRIATGERSAPIAPFFWVELFGDRLLVHGTLDPDIALTILAGELDGPGFVAATIRDGRTTGIIGCNMPREFRQQRALITEPVAALAPA